MTSTEHSTQARMDPPRGYLHNVLAAAAYFLAADGQVRQLQKFENAIAADELKRHIPILILARAHYQEHWQRYPIRSVRALKKVLQLQQTSKLELHYIGELVDGHRVVLTVRPNSNCESILQRAWLIFPESLLIAQSLPSEHGALVTVDNPTGPYFLYKPKVGHWQSVRRTGVVRDSKTAALTLGAEAQIEQLHLNENASVDRYLRGLTRLNSADWFTSFQSFSDQGERKPLPWVPMLVASASVLLLYVGVSNAMLNWQLQSRTSDLQAVDAELNQAMRIRQQIDTQIEVREAALQYQVRPAVRQTFWSVVAELNQEGVVITRVRYAGNRITILANAESGIAVLAFLHQRPYTVSAEFATPVTSGRFGERFTIDLTVKEAWSDEE